MKKGMKFDWNWFFMGSATKRNQNISMLQSLQTLTHLFAPAHNVTLNWLSATRNITNLILSIGSVFLFVVGLLLAQLFILKEVFDGCLPFYDFFILSEVITNKFNFDFWDIFLGSLWLLHRLLEMNLTDIVIVQNAFEEFLGSVLFFC